MLRAGPLARFRVKKGKKLYLRDTPSTMLRAGSQTPGNPDGSGLHSPFFISLLAATSYDFQPIVDCRYVRGHTAPATDGPSVATSYLGGQSGWSNGVVKRTMAQGRERRRGRRGHGLAYRNLLIWVPAAL